VRHQIVYGGTAPIFTVGAAPDENDVGRAHGASVCDQAFQQLLVPLLEAVGPMLGLGIFEVDRLALARQIFTFFLMNLELFKLMRIDRAFRRCRHGSGGRHGHSMP